jgi:hypothetical protein
MPCAASSTFASEKYFGESSLGKSREQLEKQWSPSAAVTNEAHGTKTFVTNCRAATKIIANAGMLILWLATLTACAMPDKHKNFASIMDSLVGQTADNRRGPQFGRIQEAKEVRELPNGTLEYVMDYTHSGDKEPCLYILQVEKSTRRFTDWRYVSQPNACYVIP